MVSVDVKHHVYLLTIHSNDRTMFAKHLCWYSFFLSVFFLFYFCFLNKVIMFTEVAKKIRKNVTMSLRPDITVMVEWALIFFLLLSFLRIAWVQTRPRRSTKVTSVCLFFHSIILRRPCHNRHLPTTSDKHCAHKAQMTKAHFSLTYIRRGTESFFDVVIVTY